MRGIERPDLPHVIICTDGSCEPNPGKAGWGAAFYFDHREEPQKAWGYIGEGTSPLAELVAAIEAHKLGLSN